MKEILSFLFDFITIFLIIYIIYSVFLNKKRKSYSKLKKSDEVKLFILRYDLDMKKTNYKKVLNCVTLINSIILSFSTAIIIRIDGFIWSIIVGIAVVMVLMYSLYELTGRYFKRKEEDKDV